MSERQETPEEKERRITAEATLAKLTSKQRNLLENFREQGKVPISILFPETRTQALKELEELRDHGILSLIDDVYEFTEEGFQVAVANLNELLRAYYAGEIG